MAQAGIYSAYQLGLHNHLDNTNGGILNDYSRFGAFREAYRTGALAVHVDNDAEVTSAAAVYTLLKQFTIRTAQKGEYRIAWESASTVAGQDIATRFYVNGVAVGAADTHDSAIYQAVTEDYDIDLALGDLIQVYGRRVGACSVKVRNFRIYYDWAIKYFHDGTHGRVLTTPLTLSDTTALDVTADF